MKEIKLNQKCGNKEQFVALVDDEDFDYVNQFWWYADKKGRTYYANRSLTHGTSAMHREIMQTSEDMQVDHIDHNGLNNQKSNLRNVTRAQNSQNRSAIGRSKYLGVTISKLQNGKMQIKAAIRLNGVQKHLGTFKTEEDAARAYDKTAKIYRGEFANLNFPDGKIPAKQTKFK